MSESRVVVTVRPEVARFAAQVEVVAAVMRDMGRQLRRLTRAADDLDRRIRHAAHCPPPCPDMGDYQRRCRARRRRRR